MLNHLIKKEVLDSLLNQRFMTLAIFSIVLMPLSAVINYKYYDARQTAFESQFAEFNQEEDIRVWDVRAYRAPELLSTLVAGVEPYMPIYYSFNSQLQETRPGNIEAEDFSAISTFGSFDLLFLVQVVFSLMAVLLAFDMIAGEKERGTLKALLSNSIPRDSILLGKFIGGFLVLWLTFLIGFLLQFLVLNLFDGRFLAGDILGRILSIVAISTLFLGGFYSLGLMISTFCHSTRTAIVALLVTWVVLQLVIPKASEMVATVVSPVRSEFDVRVDRRGATDDMIEAAAEEGGALYIRYSGEESLRNANQVLASDATWTESFREEYLQLIQEKRQQQRSRVNEIDQAWEREKQQQRRVTNSIALLSPASALSFLMMDAANTGDLAYSNYKKAVADHNRIVDQVVFTERQSFDYRLSFQGTRLMGRFGRGKEINPDAIPELSITEPTLGTVIEKNIWAMLTLLFYLFVPFTIGYIRFMRYDVR